MVPDNTSKKAGFGWQVRAFNINDIPGIAAVFDAADRADHLYKLSSEEDIRISFGDLLGTANSPARAIVAVGPIEAGAPGTGLLGVGRVSQRFHGSTQERVYYAVLRVHPSARSQGLQHTIARKLVQIAHELESDPAAQPAEKVRLLTYVFDSQASSIEAWEKVGLRRVRAGWTMARGLSEPVQVEPAPDAVLLRTYRYPEDNQSAVEAYNSALYDYYDFHPVSPSSWESELAAPYSRPELSWLAISEAAPSKIIDVAGCQVNESQNRKVGRQEGWIEGIGVVPAFRHRGIGRALLSRCLKSFRDVGLEVALADVDSESTAVVGLFQAAGFTVRSSLLQYECALEGTQVSVES